MSLHGQMLTYGMIRGTTAPLFHVDDPSIHGGKACNCVCPECGEDLKARRGGHNKHHFAHVSGRECHYARMTALHLLAQQVLERDKVVMLPEYKTEYVSHEAEVRTFDRVDLERVYKDNTSTRKPDCACYNKGRNKPLWVEIYCRHKVNSERQEDIIRRKEYCIEIDFHDLLAIDYNEEIVIKRLTQDTSHRKWICCPKWDEENELLKEEAIGLMQKREEERIALSVDQFGARSTPIRKDKTIVNVDLPLTQPIAKDKLVNRLDTLLKNESDVVTRDIVKEIWSASNAKREQYQDSAAFSNYISTHRYSILTQGETYELFKYAIVIAITRLENEGRSDLVDILLTDQDVRRQYLIFMSLYIERSLLFQYEYVEDLRKQFPDICRIYRDPTHNGANESLKEIWNITTKIPI